MADDITKAILLAMNPDPSQPAEFRQQAEQYLIQLKEWERVWDTLVEKYTSSQHGEVKFFCLTTLMELAQNPERWTQLGEAGQDSFRFIDENHSTEFMIVTYEAGEYVHQKLQPFMEIFIVEIRDMLRGFEEREISMLNMPSNILTLDDRNHVLSWAALESTLAESAYVQNKLAGLIAVLCRLDPPWPNFMQKMISTLQWQPADGSKASDQTKTHAEMFVRLAFALDEEACAPKEARGLGSFSPEWEQILKVSMRVKDQLRDDGGAATLANVLLTISSLYQDFAPALAGKSLEALAAMINWADIKLISNDQVLSGLISVMGTGLSGEKTTQGDNVAAGSAAVLTVAIGKGMLPMIKLSFLEHVQSKGLHASVSTLASREMSISARDGSLDEDETGMRIRMANLAAVLLHEALEITQHLYHARDDVPNESISRAVVQVEAAVELATMYAASQTIAIANTVITSVLSYAQLTRTSSKRIYLDIPLPRLKSLLQIIPQHLTLVAQEYDAEQAENDEDYANELQEELRNGRREWLNLFKIIGRYQSGLTLGFLQNVLAESQQSNMEHSVESAITLLHHAGEVFPEVTIMKNCGELEPLIVSVLSYDWGKLRVHRGYVHRTLAMLVQDFAVRFTNVVKHYKEDGESLELGKRSLLSASLNFFIGQQGLSHPVCQVRSRAGYLVMKYIRSLRSEILECGAELVNTVLSGLEIAMSSALEAKKDDVLDVRTASDGLLDVFEAIAVLLTNPDPGVSQDFERVINILSIVSTTLRKVIETLDFDDGRGACIAARCLTAISNLSKGIPESVVQKTPNLITSFGEAYSISIAGLKRLRSSPLGEKLISFIHRMVVVLSEFALPQIPSALEALILGASAREFHAGVLLLNQLISKFGEKIRSVLSEGGSGVVTAATKAILGPSCAPPPQNDNSETGREAREVQRVFLAFVTAMLSNNLVGTLESQANTQMAATEDFLKIVHTAATDASTIPPNRKTAMLALEMLAERVPLLMPWDVLVRSVLVAIQAVKPDDAQSLSVIQECSNAVVLSYRLCPRGVEGVAEFILNSTERQEETLAATVLGKADASAIKTVLLTMAKRLEISLAVEAV